MSPRRPARGTARVNVPMRVPAAEPGAAERPVPLCVDLDGTLIRSDLLVESFLLLLRGNPLYALRAAAWLAHGKARLKTEIARRVQLDAATLPYRDELLAWLGTQAQQRPLVLATASDAALAQGVADHLGIFSETLASDGRRNLSGARKAEALCERFGERGFDYAGNERVDLAVWRHARRAVVVDASDAVAHEAANVTTVERRFERATPRWRAWLKALRPHQWLKNLLVFLPLLTSHLALDPASAVKSLLAFVAFGLCASSVYLLNDLLDLQADRRHPRKRHRPLAAGTLPLLHGLAGAPLLLFAAFTLAFAIAPLFAAVLAGYYVMTAAYSFLLKRVVMVDVVTLAGLYTIRIIAGTAAIGLPPSFWLLAFSMFLFLSLALVKRYAELHAMREEGRMEADGRGYAVTDLSLLSSLGTGSGMMSVLVLALYINSSASQLLYRHPEVLWLLCPLLLYWISRTWLFAHRGAMHDDPVVFAATDRISRVIALLGVLIVAGAI